MARITLIGGHGKVALLAEPLLVQDGHEVTAIIRNPEHAADVEATGASAQVVSVEDADTEQLTDLFTGQDIVIWSAGAGGGDSKRTYAVDRDAAIRAIDAAVAAQVPRFVMVSYYGASVNHGVPQDNSFFPYAEAKGAADAHLRESRLQWTILMPSQLTLDPSRGTLDPEPTENGPTPRALVADVIRAVVAADPQDVTELDFPFTDGDVPIDKALRRAAEPR